MYSFRRPRKYNYLTETKTGVSSANDENCKYQTEIESNEDTISRLPSNLTLKTPSPSRHSIWKKELGSEECSSEEEKVSRYNSDDEPEADQNKNNGFCSVIELQALQTELNKKEKQREEILQQVKVNSDKVKAYKKQLNKSEQSKRSQLKLTTSNYENQLKEKTNLIMNLQEIINEKDLRIKEIESTECSKDERVSTTRHSTQKLIDLLLLAQEDKGRAMETVLKLQSAVDKIEQELALTRKSVLEIEIKNTKLNFQNDELRREKLSLLEDKENDFTQKTKTNNQVEKDYYKEIDGLHQIIKEKEYELKMNKLKHAEDMEVLGTKLQNTESKYMSAVGTPPKHLAVSKKINEAYERRLKDISELELRCKEQEVTITNTKQQYDEKIERLGSEIDCLQSTLQKSSENNNDLQNKNRNVNNQLNLIQKDFYHQQAQNKSLEEMIKKKDNSISTIREEMRQTVEALLEEKDKAVATITSEVSLETSQMVESMAHNLSQIKALQDITKELRNNKDKLVECVNIWKQSAVIETQTFGTKVLNTVKHLDTANIELRKKYKKEMKLRKKYHNELIELKGNIRVLCRIRPTINEDFKETELPETVVDYDKEDDSVIHIKSVKTGPKSFEVDRVFNSMSSQEEVFNEVKSLITSCIDGYNVCIFAYGQTGSGKTYTMEGSESDPGINQRALQQLFNDTKERSEWNYEISVNVMEIYNETLRDLLSIQPETKLDIKQGKDGLYIPDLNHVRVTSRKEINEVFKLGHSNRSTAATDMNEHSSRSHAILTVTVRGENTITGATLTGKLNLVDLAGSERLSKSGSQGQRIKEAQNINKSLSSLGDVIHALKNKSAHIPYRNSRLTYLLQDSLGGDCKTLMVVQVSPVLKNQAETICSLNFAQRVRSVELGPSTAKR